MTEAVAPTRPNIRIVLAGLMTAMMLAMLDNMIVSTALPRIVGDFGGLDHFTWVVTAYVLGTTVSTPIWGKLGDLYGRKAVFLTSIVIFLIGRRCVVWPAPLCSAARPTAGRADRVPRGQVWSPVADGRVRRSSAPRAPLSAAATRA